MNQPTIYNNKWMVCTSNPQMVVCFDNLWYFEKNDRLWSVSYNEVLLIEVCDHGLFFEDSKTEWEKFGEV